MDLEDLEVDLDQEGPTTPSTTHSWNCSYRSSQLGFLSRLVLQPVLLPSCVSAIR